MVLGTQLGTWTILTRKKPDSYPKKRRAEILARLGPAPYPLMEPQSVNIE